MSYRNLQWSARRKEDQIVYGEWYATSRIEMRDGVRCRVWKCKAVRKRDIGGSIIDSDYWEVRWEPVEGEMVIEIGRRRADME